MSWKIDLLLSVRMSSDYYSYIWVLPLFCYQEVCDHTLLHDVSSWGTRYYPITPRFSKQAAVSQMVITSSEDETSVKIFLSGEVLFRGNVYPEGSFLELHMGTLQSLCLQTNSSFSGLELNSQKAVVVVFTCSEHTPGACLYGILSTESSG